MNWLQAIIQGQQKAIVSGLVAGALSLLALIGVTGDLTVKEALIALANWVITHAAVFYTTNK